MWFRYWYLFSTWHLLGLRIENLNAFFFFPSLFSLWDLLYINRKIDIQQRSLLPDARMTFAWDRGIENPNAMGMEPVFNLPWKSFFHPFFLFNFTFQSLETKRVEIKKKPVLGIDEKKKSIFNEMVTVQRSFRILSSTLFPLQFLPWHFAFLPPFFPFNFYLSIFRKKVSSKR